MCHGVTSIILIIQLCMCVCVCVCVCVLKRVCYVVSLATKLVTEDTMLSELTINIISYYFYSYAQ